jgi:hypothetical protein
MSNQPDIAAQQEGASSPRSETAPRRSQASSTAWDIPSTGWGKRAALVSNLEEDRSASENRPVVSAYHYRCLRGADVRRSNLAAPSGAWKAIHPASLGPVVTGEAAPK